MPMTRPRTSAASSDKRRCSRRITLHQSLDLAPLDAALDGRRGFAAALDAVIRVSRLELIDALLELANALPHRARYLRDPLGTEDEKYDDEDEKQFLYAESANTHTSSQACGKPIGHAQSNGPAVDGERDFPRNAVALAPACAVCYLSRAYVTPTIRWRYLVNDASKAVWYLLGQDAQRTRVRYARAATRDGRADDARTRVPEEGRGRAQALARQRAAHLHPRRRAEILAGRGRRARARCEGGRSAVHPVQPAAQSGSTGRHARRGRVLA